MVFVLPAASRVMHSNLNARLLMQYSNSLGKKTSIVSPDARTQGTAIETGFDTFPSMAAFESGHALERAVAATHASSPIAGALAAGALSDIPAAPMRRPAATPGPVVSPRARPVAARPVVAAPAAGATAVHVERHLGALPWILGAVGIFLVALILVFFVLPSATVTITVSARPVNTAPTVTGSTQAPPPDQQLALQTALQQAQEQQQQQVTSTGQKVIPAVPAQVVVTVKNDGTFGFSFEAGKTYEVVSNDGKKFHTVPPNKVPIDPGSSADVTFTAVVGGAAGNVGPHTITTLTGGPPGSSVDNKAAAAGGKDEEKKTVVGQSDIDKVKQALGEALTAKVKTDLQAKAGKDTVLADTLTTDVAVAADHQPGDEVPNFNATVTVKGHATSVSEDKLKSLLLAALTRQVIPGYHLTDDKPKIAYKEVQHDDNGGVVWDGTASGFMATAVNDGDLRTKVSGKSPKEAVSYVKGHYDAQSATVTISPPFVPWLPFNGSNIHFRTQVENTTPTG
ncbi:MAG: baseplate J/gp47 family protein [Candidatus Dormibacteria bacterium]